MTKAEILKYLKEMGEEKIVVGKDEFAWTFFIHANTIIEGQDLCKDEDSSFVTINISDMKLFCKKINEYLSEAKEFYKDQQDYFLLEDKDFEKLMFVTIFAKFSVMDFQNIYNAIDKETKMLQTNLCHHKKLGEIAEGRLSYTIKKNFLTMEAPYKITFYISYQGAKFELPSIHFGIEKNKARVMSIQNMNTHQDNIAEKKFDRYFRKVNKGIDEEDFIHEVSPNALVSLTLFMEYLRENDITSVTAPDYLPIRFSSSLASRRAKHKENFEVEEEKLNNIQFNLTNKFVYTLYRYAHHFDNARLLNNDTGEIEIKLLNKSAVAKEDNIIYQIAEAYLAEKQK